MVVVVVVMVTDTGIYEIRQLMLLGWYILHVFRSKFYGGGGGGDGSGDGSRDRRHQTAHAAGLVHTARLQK